MFVFRAKYSSAKRKEIREIREIELAAVVEVWEGADLEHRKESVTKEVEGFDAP